MNNEFSEGGNKSMAEMNGTKITFTCNRIETEQIKFRTEEMKMINNP